MFRKKQWNDSLSMIPSIMVGIYQSYQFYPKYATLSPMMFTLSMTIAFQYHYLNYRDNVTHYKWLRYDLVSQLLTTLISTYFTDLGMDGALAILTMMFVSIHLDLESTPQRCYAYVLNGICCLLSVGTVIELWLYWFINFMVFSICYVFPNTYTHSIFHLIATHICYLTWQHSFVSDTGNNDRVIERHSHQTNNG